MQISFNTLGSSLGRGDMIQAEVVASHENGSMVMVNGVPVSTDKALPPGKKMMGKVETVDGNQAVVTLLPETPGEPSLTLPERWLAANQFPVDAETQALFDMFRRLNIPLNQDLFQKARDLFQTLGLGQDKTNLNALGFLLLKNLPKSAFSMVKDYLAGGLRFGKLLESLSDADRAALMKEWSSGKLLEKLASFLDPEKMKEIQKELREKLPGELSRNLAFQEALSVVPQEKQEGRMYFQWPMFWHGQQVPDTLEGEAFFSKPGKDGMDGGFSLRILVQPPRLGPLEVNIHRMTSNLWVHFGSDRPPENNPIKDIFSDLNDSLANLGWKSIRLTVGNKSSRPNFLGSPENDAALPPLKKIDVRV